MKCGQRTMTSVEQTTLSGWGNIQSQDCFLARASSLEEAKPAIQDNTIETWIPRGLGRAYRDAALNRDQGVLRLQQSDGKISWNPDARLARVWRGSVSEKDYRTRPASGLLSAHGCLIDSLRQKSRRSSVETQWTTLPGQGRVDGTEHFSGHAPRARSVSQSESKFDPNLRFSSSQARRLGMFSYRV